YDMATSAYHMGPVQDQRDECRLVPNRNATTTDLDKIGVKLCTVEMTPGWEERLDELAKMHEMKNRDEIHISRKTMLDFDEKLKMFFEEHLHRDSEVRFVKDGTGYFDVRSAEDEWIRIPVRKGDFVFLPAGIYHRFTTDKKEDLIAIRLFKTVPRWEAFNRCADGDSVEERKDYLKSLLKSS
uniref:Acireductone dioxygenase n=1 Tax=Haemonchus contortus TaxID=6289 RepID=A0A7I4Y2G1_HAECO